MHPQGDRCIRGWRAIEAFEATLKNLGDSRRLLELKKHWKYVRLQNPERFQKACNFYLDLYVYLFIQADCTN